MIHFYLKSLKVIDKLSDEKDSKIAIHIIGEMVKEFQLGLSKKLGKVEKKMNYSFCQKITRI